MEIVEDLQQLPLLNPFWEDCHKKMNLMICYAHANLLLMRWVSFCLIAANIFLYNKLRGEAICWESSILDSSLFL